MVCAPPILGAVHRCLPRSLQIRLLHMYHYLHQAKHSEEHSMQETMPYDVYWSNSADNGYTMLNILVTLHALEQKRRICHSCNSSRFSSLLKLITMEILKPLLEEITGNQSEVIMKLDIRNSSEQYQTSGTCLMPIMSSFYSHGIVLYGISAYLRTHNVTKHMRKFSKTICSLLGLKDLKVTAYHLKTNRQAELWPILFYEDTNGKYWPEQRHWDSFVKLLTQGYNTQLHWYTRTTPFSLVLYKTSATPEKLQSPIITAYVCLLRNLHFPSYTKTAPSHSHDAKADHK